MLIFPDLNPVTYKAVQRETKSLAEGLNYFSRGATATIIVPSQHIYDY
ncbi:hypothetical protein [Candidatus Walczuchella endosymbiont of Icerya purchasi]